MVPVIYETAKWIGLVDKKFIYTHALNRKLCSEEHSHEFYEIIFLFEGVAGHKVNGTVTTVRAGDVVWLRPGDTHVWVNQTEKLELYSISAVSDEINRFLRAYCMEAQLLYAKDPVTSTLSFSQLSSIHKLFTRLDPVSDQKERDALLRIIIGEAMQCYMLQALDSKRDWFQNILFQMKEPKNLVEGVPAMMRLASMSHAQLCRTMKKLSLDPPKTYIKELRLSTAYEMIMTTSQSFEYIALCVGYASVSHFSMSFKERYGISPGALRRESSAYLT